MLKDNIIGIEKEVKCHYEVSDSVSNSPYEIIPRQLLRNEYELSLEAYASLLYMLSHKKGFRIYNSSIMKSIGIGRDRCQAAIKELKLKGFLAKSFTRDKSGKIIAWHIKVSNFPEFPCIHQKPRIQDSGICGQDTEIQVSGETPENTVSSIHQKPEKPPSGKSGILRTTIFKETTTTTAPITFAEGSEEDLVVVSLKEIGIEPEYAREYAKLGKKRVDEVLKASLEPERKIRNRVSWVNDCLRKKWKLYDESKISQKAPNTLVETRKYFDLTIMQEWYNSLTDERKTAIIEKAIRDGRLYFLKEQNVLDVDFVNTSFFKCLCEYMSRFEKSYEVVNEKDTI